MTNCKWPRLRLPNLTIPPGTEKLGGGGQWGSSQLGAVAQDKKWAQFFKKSGRVFLQNNSDPKNFEGVGLTGGGLSDGAGFLCDFATPRCKAGVS